MLDGRCARQKEKDIMFIHLLGPSGSGTSTLGKAISQRLNIPWFDSDDIFWIKTDPPFTKKRDTLERQLILNELYNSNTNLVLSGSVLKWGNQIRDKIDLIIYLYLEPEKRIKRIIEREKERFGNRIEENNDMHQGHLEFINWARKYESGDMNMRSKISEEKWIEECNCLKIRIDKEMNIEEMLSLVEREISQIHPTTVST